MLPTSAVACHRAVGVSPVTESRTRRTRWDDVVGSRAPYASAMSMTGRVRAGWVDALPVLAPVVVSFTLVVVNAVSAIDTPRPTAFTTVCGLAASTVLVARLRRPIQVLLAVASCAVLPVLAAGTAPDFYGSLVPAVISIYTVAARLPLRRAAVVPVVMAVVFGSFAVRVAQFRTVGQLLFDLIAVGLAFGTGRALRLLRQQVDTEAMRADLLVREQDVLAREAVVAERERIARELHDVIAHDVSVMVIQAGAAQRLMTGESQQVTEALSQVQDSGRKAIDELYVLLGMLREGESTLAPQPGLSAVADLVAEVARSGVPVSLRISGRVRDVGGALEVSAYRLVQESLTNVMKHSRGSQTEVELRYADTALTVCVTDDGTGTTTLPAGVPSGQHGLLGMRERVRVFGGQLSAGARPGGGWSVLAVLPLAGEPS
jgi:signal transduction histidine kinase